MSKNVVTIATKKSDVYSTIMRACLTGSKACLTLKDNKHYKEFMQLLYWAQTQYVDSAAVQLLEGE